MAKSKRYFRHDVFLSHNQKDGSLMLRDELLKLDVAAWHDGDADMSDRNVFDLVQNALNDSRFVCVCVRHGFRDSHWVRAEYERGLELTRDSGACCVIVAEMTPEAAIPPALQNQPRFRLYTDGIEPLACYVRSANHRKPIDREHLVPDAARLRRDAIKLRSLNGLDNQLWGISDNERAKLLLGQLRSGPSNGQFPAHHLIRILERVRSITERDILFAIYENLDSRDDILANATRSRRGDEHLPLDILLQPLSEFAKDPIYHDRARDLHERILARIAAIHNLSPETVERFRHAHIERSAGRWADTRPPPPPAPRIRPRSGMRLGDLAITLLGGLMIVAGVGIAFMMLNTG